MKKGFFLLIIMSLIFSAVYAQTDSQATVTAYKLNVRYGPGTSYSIITIINRGETYPIVGRNTDSSWWQIDLGGTIGWVSGLYVTAVHTENVPDQTSSGCPYASYIAPQCPTSQVNVSASIQPFEQGMMIWRSDTKMIYVLFTNGTFLKRNDSWTGEALTQETPPAGLQQPYFGMGKVWLDDTLVRGGLGWATDGESYYTTPIESDAGTHPRASDNMLYLRLDDGRIIGLNEYASTWYYQ